MSNEGIDAVADLYQCVTKWPCKHYSIIRQYYSSFIIIRQYYSSADPSVSVMGCANTTQMIY